MEHAEERDRDAHLDAARDKASLLESFILLVVALVSVTLCAYFLVHEIEFIVDEGNVSEAFLGLILVPLVEKAAEHLIAIDDAWDGMLNSFQMLLLNHLLTNTDAMDIALSHCLGATIQTALLVAPIVVIAGWGKGLEMDLDFEYVLGFPTRPCRSSRGKLCS